MKSSITFTRKYFSKLTPAVLLLIAIFTGSLFIFGIIIHEVLIEKEEVFDIHVFNFFSAHIINSSLTGVMKTVTNFASASFLQISYGLLIIVYLAYRDYKRTVEIAIIGSGGFLVNYFLKVNFHRPRPPHPLIDPLMNFSFPSGHATSG
ncbi:MAG: hypothetical protein WKF35_03365 [Ferruginibacter sp.]